MKQGALWLTLALTALLVAGSASQAQIPDKFTNLKVLPQDISKQELQSTMRGFAFALGVRCDHCHVEKKAPEKGFDYSADNKDTKKTARVMLQMVNAINHDYVSKIEKPDKTPAIRVHCVTWIDPTAAPQCRACRKFEQKGGLAKTIALYHELRGKYYGSGQYDFGETALNLLTESLLASKEKLRRWRSWSSTSPPMAPIQLWSYHLLAMTHEANGQIDKAITDYRKVLELHPDDTWAKQQVDSLSKAKQQ